MLKRMAELLAGLLAFAAPAAVAVAADYPNRPVTIVVGFRPAGRAISWRAS